MPDSKGDTTTQTTPEWSGRKPDGSLHPVYVAHVKAEWQAARDRLVRAAEAGRAAHRTWDDAIEREMKAHRRMREVLEEIGEALP